MTSQSSGPTGGDGSAVFAPDDDPPLARGVRVPRYAKCSDPFSIDAQSGKVSAMENDCGTIEEQGAEI